MGRSTFVFTAALVAGCGSGNEPSSAVTGLSLEVNSAEYEVGRSLVLVGESSSARISAVTDQGCIFTSPCSIETDVVFRSSAPQVISAKEQEVRTPAMVALVAHAPGTATLTVTANGISESRRVDVVSEPLPLDAIRITLETSWNDFPAQYDASQSLSSVEVPVGEYGALNIVPLRAGAEVFGIPISLNSNSTSVAQGSIGCRPVEVDADCGVYSDGWIWGVTSGDAQVTVLGRNVSASFTARVP